MQIGYRKEAAKDVIDLSICHVICQIDYVKRMTESLNNNLITDDEYYSLLIPEVGEMLVHIKRAIEKLKKFY